MFKLDEDGEPSQRLDFVVVRTKTSSFHLTRAEGARVVERLGRWFAPRWITFSDMHGSLVTLPTSAIREIFDSGPASRASEAALNIALLVENVGSDETSGTDDGE